MSDERGVRGLHQGPGWVLLRDDRPAAGHGDGGGGAAAASRWGCSGGRSPGCACSGFAAVVLLVVVPVRGRSATQWVGALVAHTLGRGLGWSAFRGKVAVGEPAAPDDADLPGILAGVQVHDGPPRGARLTRVALIQDHAAQTWAATARIVHPGIGIAEARERDRMGEGLAQLHEVLARTDLARMLVIQVRTVPDDGAERAQWVAKNRRADAPALSRRVNDDLAVSLTSAGGAHRGVRHRGGRRVGDRPAGPAGRPRADRPGPGALRPAGRSGGAPARRGPLHQRGLAGLGGPGRRGADRVRARRPGRPGAGRRRRRHPPRHQHLSALGGGRTGAGMHAGALVRPRRLVLGVGGGAAAGPGRHPRGVWRRCWSPAPRGSGAATPCSTRWSRTARPPARPPARRSPPPPVGRCADGSGSRPGPGSDATRPRPTPWTPSWPAAAP